MDYLWKMMFVNIWFVEEVSMNDDKRDYLKLSVEEKIGYDRVLA